MPEPVYNFGIALVAGSFTDLTTRVERASWGLALIDLLSAPSPQNALFELDNEDGTLYPTVNQSLVPGAALRLTATYSGATYPLFYGRITEVSASPTLGKGTVLVQALDDLDRVNKILYTTPLYLSTTVRSLFTTLMSLSSVNTFANGADEDVIENVWYIKEPGPTALHKLVKSGNSGLMVDGAGKYNILGRHARDGFSSVGTYDSVADSLRFFKTQDNIINRALLSAATYTSSVTVKVLAHLASPYLFNSSLSVAASTALNFTLDFWDQDDKMLPIAVGSAITPVKSTDYFLCNSQSFLLGTDITSGLTVVFSHSGASAVVSLYNGNAVTGYLRFQVRGYPLVKSAKNLTITAEDTTSQVRYGVREMIIDSSINDLDFLANYAKSIILNRANPIDRAELSLTNEFPDVLQRTAADLISIINSKASTSTQWVVRGETHELQLVEGLRHSKTYNLEKYVAAGVDTPLFATTVYKGTGTLRTIVNSVDLFDRGGLVMSRQTSLSNAPTVFNDFVRGPQQSFVLPNTDPSTTTVDGVLDFNTDGYRIQEWAGVGANIIDYVSWVFARHRKFFDAVGYTGNGTTQVVSHNLQTAPGLLVVKKIDISSSDWTVFHPSVPVQSGGMFLNSPAGVASHGPNYWGNNSTYVTPTQATFTVGSESTLNTSGASHIAYLFANNTSGDPELTSSSNRLIATATTMPASGQAVSVDLGIIPRWLLFKGVNSSHWTIIDSARGWGAGTIAISDTTPTSSLDFGSPLVVASGDAVDGFSFKNAYGISGTVVMLAEGSAVTEMLIFELDLITSLIVNSSIGSGTPTFTRATVATQIDFENKYNQALSGEARFQGARRVANYAPATESFAGWTLSGTGSIVANNAIAPDGTLSAATLTAPVNGDGAYGYPGSGTSGQTVVLSIWIRGAISGNVRLRNAYTGTGLVNLPVTTSWNRFTIATDAGALWVVGLGDPDPTTIYLWHPQDEIVTGQANQNPSEYVSVGVLSAPYHGANVDGIKYFSTLNGNTVTSNVVTEATGAAIVTGASGVSAYAPVDAGGSFGLLIEEARTSILTRSAEFDNAAWGKDGGISVTADQAVAPDGATAVDKMTRAAGVLGNWAQLSQQVAASPFGKTYSFSVWAQALSGTKNFTLTISDVNFVSKHSGQMTATTTTQRFKWEGQTGWDVAATLIGGGINIVDATGDLLVWGAQLEEASFVSSYIPTTTVAVTRNADVLSYPVTGNVNGKVGSAYAEVVFMGTSAEVNPTILGSGASQRIIIGNAQNALNFILYDGTTTIINTTNYTANAVAKVASSWGGTTASVYTNGTVQAGAFDGDLNLGTTLYIGYSQQFPTLNFWPGTIRNVRIYRIAKSASELQAMTS